MVYFVFNEKCITVEKTLEFYKKKCKVIKDGNIFYRLLKWTYSNFKINVCLPTFF